MTVVIRRNQGPARKRQATDFVCRRADAIIDIIAPYWDWKLCMFAHTNRGTISVALLHFRAGAASQTAWVCKLIVDLMKALG